MDSEKVLIVGHGELGFNTEIIRRLTEAHNKEGLIILNNQGNVIDEFDLVGLKLSDEEKEKIRDLGESIKDTIIKINIGDNKLIEELLLQQEDILNDFDMNEIHKQKKVKSWKRTKFYE